MTKKKKVDELWSGMTRKRWKVLCQYVRDRADDLGLRDWKIIMKHVPIDQEKESDPMAMVDCIFGRKVATITLCQEFDVFPKDVQREALIHELIHFHLDPVEVPVRQGSSAWRLLGDSAGDVLCNQVHKEVEMAVDGIAQSIAPLFPLP